MRGNVGQKGLPAASIKGGVYVAACTNTIVYISFTVKTYSIKLISRQVCDSVRAVCLPSHVLAAHLLLTDLFFIDLFRVRAVQLAG